MGLCGRWNMRCPRFFTLTTRRIWRRSFTTPIRRLTPAIILARLRILGWRRLVTARFMWGLPTAWRCLGFWGGLRNSEYGSLPAERAGGPALQALLFCRTRGGGP